MSISLKMFLMYIGGSLFAAIATMVVVKSMCQTFASQGRRPWIFNFVVSFLASVVAFATTWATNNKFLIYWIFSFIFLFAGVIYFRMAHNKYFKARKDNRNKQFLAEILFALAIVFLFITLFSSLQYFIRKKEFLFFPTLLSSLFFLLPVLMYHAFDAAYEIPMPIYTGWQYPIGLMKDIPDEVEGERLYVIGFEIAKKTTDVKRTYFRAKAPEGMLLGDLYYFFINDYCEQHSETPIEYASENLTHTWHFRRRPKWYQFSRVLDHNLTVRDNRIRENTVVICEREA